MELKFLTEKRAEKQDKMQEILNLAKKEERAMNPDEIKAFNDCKTEIDEIDSTISAEEELRSMQLDDEKEATTPQTEPKESVEEKEERAFANFVRGVKLENRANNLDLGSNGAVVPQTIANKIIEKVKDLCPVYSLSEIYNVKGTLVIPYYGEKSGEDVTCAYATEFTDLTSTAGKFTSVSLSSFLADDAWPHRTIRDLNLQRKIILGTRDWAVQRDAGRLGVSKGESKSPLERFLVRFCRCTKMNDKMQGFAGFIGGNTLRR